MSSNRSPVAYNAERDTILVDGVELCESQARLFVDLMVHPAGNRKGAVNSFNRNGHASIHAKAILDYVTTSHPHA